MFWDFSWDLWQWIYLPLHFDSIQFWCSFLSWFFTQFCHSLLHPVNCVIACSFSPSLLWSDSSATHPVLLGTLTVNHDCLEAIVFGQYQKWTNNIFKCHKTMTTQPSTIILHFKICKILYSFQHMMSDLSQNYSAKRNSWICTNVGAPKLLTPTGTLPTNLLRAWAWWNKTQICMMCASIHMLWFYKKIQEESCLCLSLSQWYHQNNNDVTKTSRHFFPGEQN